VDSATLATLTAWTGLLTAAAAFLAIFEMRRQRIEGYRPELIVLPPEFSLRPRQIGPVWNCTQKIRTEESAKPVPAAVECINIGAGVARSIVGTWEFDRQSAVEELSPLLAKRGYSIWHSESDGYSRIDLENGSEPGVSLVGDLSATTSIPYLQPAQTPENVLQIPPPPDFLLLLGLHLHCGADDSTRLVMLKGLPPLVLHLSFLDAGGATRNADLELRFRLSYLESSKRADGIAMAESAEATASVVSPRSRWLW
jgi:hypothetical protein